MRAWVVAYDVSDPGRLKRVARLLEGHGRRVQYSVFECWLGRSEHRDLRRGLRAEIDAGRDSIRWYPLCAWCRDRVAWRGSGDPVESTSYIIV